MDNSDNASNPALDLSKSFSVSRGRALSGVSLSAVEALHGQSSGGAVPEPARSLVKRRFIDTQAGQIHVRVCGEKSKNGKTPLLCFHQSPQSSLVYADILPYLGADRFAIAADTPGFGESFRPSAQPTIEQYASWLAEVPTELDLPRVDLIGMFTGTAIAVEFARQFPQRVRRIVLIGPAVFTDDQLKLFLANAWPTPPTEDGHFLMVEWKRVMDRYPATLPFEQKFNAFNEYYRGGLNAIFGERAVNSYDLKSVISTVTQPTLLLVPDSAHGDRNELQKLVGQMSYIFAAGKPALGLLQAEPAWVSSQILEFLDK